MKRQPTLLFALIVLVCSFAYGQTNQPAERFTANAVSLSPEYGTGQRIVEITVDRWSAHADRQELVAALQQKGADELLKHRQNTKPVGGLRTPQALGYGHHQAEQ